MTRRKRAKKRRNPIPMLGAWAFISLAGLLAAKQSGILERFPRPTPTPFMLPAPQPGDIRKTAEFPPLPSVKTYPVSSSNASIGVRPPVGGDTRDSWIGRIIRPRT